MSARVLVLDIETAPNLAYVWGLFKQDIGLPMLQETSSTLSFAAKWHGEKPVHFHSVQDGVTDMRDALWEYMHEADVVVTWNGQSFDIPHINREFVLGGYEPPSPYRQVDLYLTAKKHFRFASNKLDHVSQQLGVGAKVKHAGFSLWLGCMAGDEKAWRAMEKYNRQDVVITDRVYSKLLPWISNHPHVGLYSDNPSAPVCGRCGSSRLQRRGYAYTSVSRFQQYWCRDCGGWSRVAKRDDGVNVRPVA